MLQQNREKTVIMKDMELTWFNPNFVGEEVVPDVDPESIPVILTSAQYRYKTTQSFRVTSEDKNTKAISHDISEDEDDSRSVSSAISEIAPLIEEFKRLRLEEEAREKKIREDAIKEAQKLQNLLQACQPPASSDEKPSTEAPQDEAGIADDENSYNYDEQYYLSWDIEAPEGREKTPDGSSDSWPAQGRQIISKDRDENSESSLGRIMRDEPLEEQWPQEVEPQRELLPATRRPDGSMRKARYKKVGYKNAEDLAQERYVSMGTVEKKTEELFEKKQILSKEEARRMVLEEYRPDILEKEEVELKMQEEMKKAEELERKKRVLEDYNTIKRGVWSLLHNPPRKHLKLVASVAPDSCAIDSLITEVVEASKRVKQEEPRRFRMLVSHAGNVGSAGGALFPKKYIFFSDWVWGFCRKKQKELLEGQNSSDQSRSVNEGENKLMGKLS